MTFRKGLFLPLLLAVALAQTSVHAAERSPDLRSMLLSLQEKGQKQDCPGVLEVSAQLFAAPGFARLDEDLRLNLYRLAMACAGQAGQMDLALKYVREATKLPDATAELWQTQLGLEWQEARYADVIATTEAMARSNPAALNGFDLDMWIGLHSELKRKKEHGLRTRLLKVLSRPEYDPGPGQSVDFLRREYAVILAEAGDKAGAAAVVALVDQPKALMLMSVDPLLRHAIPEDFDAAAAVEHNMAGMREVAASHAGALRPMVMLALDYLALGQAEEAIAALQSVQPETAAADAFLDREDQVNWWWDSMARAYRLLGRYEEAVAAYSKGKSHTENGHANISQTINLAGTQLRFGRPADALATLKPIADGRITGSPYGLMRFHTVQGCAAFLTGKKELAQADLAYLTEHVDDAPLSLTELQLCMGDIEGAAASTVRQLDTPEQRVSALLLLSDYAPEPATYPVSPHEAGIPQLRARADVQAAIARAGGTRRFNVPRSY